MKKALILAITAAAALAGSQALAANVTSGDLIRVVYSTDGAAVNEVATDLGAIDTTTLGSVGQAGSNFSASQVGGSFTNAFVAYVRTTSAFDTWVSFGSALPAVTTTNSASNLRSGYTAMVGTNGYNSASYTATAGTLAFPKSNANSYVTKMDTLGAGTFGGLFTSNVGEQGISTLNGTASTYVDQLLLHYTGTTSGLTLQTADTKIVRTFGDGSTQILAYNQSPVPIPGAVVLLGSGLAGLLGIRRKVS